MRARTEDVIWPWYEQEKVVVLQGVPLCRRYRSVFAGESPFSNTKDRKAKQQTLGASGNDRQDDDHAPGNS